MTQYLPKDIGEWMRSQEKRIQALERRRLPAIPGMGLDLSGVVRWQSRLSSSANLASTSYYNLGYGSLYAAPYHNPQGVIEYLLPGNEPRYYIRREGFYLVTMNLQWDTGAGNSSRKIHIFKNADSAAIATSEMPAISTNGLNQSISTIIPFLKDEYFRVGAISHGAAATILTGAGAGGAGYAGSNLVVTAISGF